MKSSDLLLEFYKAYRDWAEEGCCAWTSTAFNPYGFRKYEGLCGNVDYFTERKGIPTHELREELQAQFEEAGLDRTYPFNDHTDENCWIDYSDDYDCPDNPDRCKWVLDRIAEMEEPC